MKKQTIYLILFIVVLTWGFNVTATKILVTNFMPVTMTAFRIFTASIFVIGILFFTKKLRMLTQKEFLYVVVGALFNVVAHHYFLSIGLLQTSAANGGLILGLGPLLTTILAILFLGSIVTLPKIIGILLGICGVTFIVLDNQGGLHGASIGDFYVFLSIFFQAASFIVIKKVSKTLDPRVMTGYMLLIGSVILFGISLLVEPSGLKGMASGDYSLWVIFFASALLATAFGHFLYNYALGKVGVTEASIFINLTPFFALVGAAIFLGEQIVMGQIIGFLFILLGILLGSGTLEELLINRVPFGFLSVRKKGK
ncbi:DMT family transporter [Bacillus sp. 03113]|uniref:DMT family transporter n=1 Tax=Bacillus sp. 03113 TaxID=2578211 RepID=UPI001142295E|nr:DMT family transporter [Bacillus sp. 03113]